MAIRLLSITFNHDPASARSSALNLRLNAEEEVSGPEWVGGRDNQFPAAYSIADTVGALIFLEAEFAGMAGERAEVAAVPAFLHVLGSLGPQPVLIGSNGRSGPLRIPLLSHGLLFATIATHDVRWRWLQRRSAVDGWQPLTETAHRIYTVLRTPTEPWIQQPFRPSNTQIPWAAVLELACLWASGARTPAVAATAITLSLFAFAGERFRYNCEQGAPTNYSAPQFDCTAFVERVAGGHGRGPDVNCTDCATIVSTLANAVGCDLSQARMFNQFTPFAVNPMRLIGHPLFAPVCGRGVFNYHEVAWGGLSMEFDEVYDACLELMAPAPPQFPLTAIVPANVLFGLSNQGLYRDLLAAPASRHICRPQPLTRTRRAVF